MIKELAWKDSNMFKDVTDSKHFRNLAIRTDKGIMQDDIAITGTIRYPITTDTDLMVAMYKALKVKLSNIRPPVDNTLIIKIPRGSECP